MKIIVPATSANIGPGFDSVGLAVSRYLVIEVLSKAPEWFVEHDLGNDVPSDTGNLLLQTALSVAPDLPPHQLKMTSDIPLARGLGSSSSVIVAGIELANQLGNLSLSTAEKLRLATEFEGHPDNVAPALLGNLVISSFTEGNLETVVSDFPECDLVAFIPDYELKTSDSRQVLPTELAYGEAVAASSIANLAVAALLKGNLTQAGRLIEADRFHQPYRQALVKEYDSIKAVGKVFGAFATYLSGAGPTIMTLLPKGQGQDFVKHLEGLNLSGTIAPLAVDKEGVQVIK